MARKSVGRDFSTILNVAHEWMDRCLVQDGSILSEAKLWTFALLQELQSSIVEHPDEGTDSFYTKLGGQLHNTSPAAKQLMAELLWGAAPISVQYQTRDQAEGHKADLGFVR